MLFGVGLVCAVLATVAMLGVRRAYPRELVKALREGRPHVFDAAPVGAEPFGLTRADHSTLVAARDALADPEPRVRRVCAHVLGDLGPEDAEELLIVVPARRRRRCARHRDRLARAGAGSTQALPQILGCADDPDTSVRRATVEAVTALGTHG